MTSQNFVALMYHELQCAGRPLCNGDAGYTRYVVTETTFQAQLALLTAREVRGQSLSQALESGGLAVTFDDGCETDLLTAAPHLQEAGFGATFYIVSAWIGRPGFLNSQQVAELAGQGFEIGSHGQTHAFLSDLPDEKLRAEMRDSKTALEDIIGRKVAHFSCPGGRFDARVASVGRELGYASVATSRAEVNLPGADPFRLGRMPVLQGTTLTGFERLCRGEVSGREKLRGALLGAAKTVLGNGAYQKMRGAALDQAASKAGGKAAGKASETPKP